MNRLGFVIKILIVIALCLGIGMMANHLYGEWQDSHPRTHEDFSEIESWPER